MVDIRIGDEIPDPPDNGNPKSLLVRTFDVTDGTLQEDSDFVDNYKGKLLLSSKRSEYKAYLSSKGIITTSDFAKKSFSTQLHIIKKVPYYLITGGPDELYAPVGNSPGNDLLNGYEGRIYYFKIVLIDDVWTLQIKFWVGRSPDSEDTHIEISELVSVPVTPAYFIEEGGYYNQDTEILGFHFKEEDAPNYIFTFNGVAVGGSLVPVSLTFYLCPSDYTESIPVGDNPWEPTWVESSPHDFGIPVIDTGFSVTVTTP